MTPEQATERWCPFARVVKMQGDHPTDAEAYQQTRCIAHGCMAWRWSWSPEQAARARRVVEGTPLPTSLPKPSGYCGLAGSHGN